jgi:hypothetical protein
VTALIPSYATASLVVIDQDTIIDAANSFPEPPVGEPPLFVEIQNGSAGAPVVQLVDGGVIGGFVTVSDESHLIMRGGEIKAETRVVDQATLTISGGLIAPLIRLYDTTDVVGVLGIEDQATLNIRGGYVVGIIFQYDSSTINVYGYDFSAVGDLPTSLDNNSLVQITGFYPDHSPLLIDIARLSTNAKVFLHTVPEPSPSLLLSWAIVSFRRRSRRGRSL